MQSYEWDVKLAMGSLPTANQHLSHWRALGAECSLESKELSLKPALPIPKYLLLFLATPVTCEVPRPQIEPELLP